MESRMRYKGMERRKLKNGSDISATMSQKERDNQRDGKGK